MATDRSQIRKVSLTALVVIGGLFLALFLSTPIWSPRLTNYIESDKFHAEMEKETAKGLHFPDAHFAPIKRTGMWTAESAGFDADKGWKALRSIEARGISAKFNPWGIFLRRWQLDYVNIQRGKVEIQVYEPKSEPKAARPWYALFLPDRVYLKRVESIEPIDVTWEFRDKRAGFFATHLLITPHGRDFEYQARGGELRMSPLPNLRLQHTHLLITKTLLTLYHLDLQPETGATGKIHAEGRAGTRDDKSVDFTINLDRMPLEQLLPNEWNRHIKGEVTSQVHWQGENPRLEKSGGDIALTVENGRIAALPFMKKLAALSGEKELENLRLNECRFDLAWNYPRFDLKNLRIEDKGKICAEGSLSLQNKSLGGAIELGVAPRLLNWLPKREEIFPKEHDGYLWTTVHFSGTIDAPEQDLSPRLVEAIKDSPGTAFGILFRGLGQWLKDAFGSEE
jgi:hypothetical protein